METTEIGRTESGSEAASPAGTAVEGSSTVAAGLYPRPLELPAEVSRRLERLAVDGHPHEVCGLLVGRETPSATRVERLTTAANLAADRLGDRYLLDPRDFLAADREARRLGLEIVGIWHTHPDHPAVPSVTDAEAAWEGYSYLILSVRSDGVAGRRAWRLDRPRAAEPDLANPNIFVEQNVKEA